MTFTIIQNIVYKILILCCFLKTLEPPISSVGAIKRWHPEFALEDLPDIEEAALPKPPTMEKLETAKDVLGNFFNI